MATVVTLPTQLPLLIHLIHETYIAGKRFSASCWSRESSWKAISPGQRSQHNATETLRGPPPAQCCCQRSSA